MRNPSLLASILFLGLFSGTLAQAEESTLKEDAKKIGQETGELVRKVGEESKEFGKQVAEVAREVGHATRDGAKEFTQAVKGETDSKATSSSSSSAPAHQHKSN